jgi:hypothetical protein
LQVADGRSLMRFGMRPQIRFYLGEIIRHRFDVVIHAFDVHNQSRSRQLINWHPDPILSAHRKPSYLKNLLTLLPES